jgi:hypothetical protein
VHISELATTLPNDYSKMYVTQTLRPQELVNNLTGGISAYELMNLPSCEIGTHKRLQLTCTQVQSTSHTCKVPLSM